MFIIAGLGNPTREYAATRHNIGFDAVTALSDAWRIRLEKKEMKALCGKGNFAGERIVLAQPQTFMNLSGESIRALTDFYKVEADSLIVLCDDVNLAPGQLRIRKKGSAGGHNGLKNIILHLGTEEFVRIRIGVGEKPKEWDLADYVLGHFPKDEEPLMREALADAVKACELILTEGVDAAMNRYNRKKAEPENGQQKPDKAAGSVEQKPGKAADSAEQKPGKAAGNVEQKPGEAAGSTRQEPQEAAEQTKQEEAGIR